MFALLKNLKDEIDIIIKSKIEGYLIDIEADRMQEYQSLSEEMSKLKSEYEALKIRLNLLESNNVK